MKFQKFEICTLHVYYSQKQILDKYTTHYKSNSTSFMVTNIFCEMNGKKVIYWGGAWGNGGTVLISSWKCNFGIYLDIQLYYLDIQAITTLVCFLLVLYVLVPSIHSIFYVTTALLKSDVFRHSKAIFSTSFGPTRMGLGSFWREMKWVSRIALK